MVGFALGNVLGVEKTDVGGAVVAGLLGKALGGFLGEVFSATFGSKKSR